MEERQWTCDFEFSLSGPLAAVMRASRGLRGSCWGEIESRLGGPGRFQGLTSAHCLITLKRYCDEVGQWTTWHD
eukprot:7042666-Pyramimonas_sp.AAC.1